MGGWQSTMHTSMYSRGGEMAALCGCQSAHLAPLSPINRAYNREAASLSAARELQPWKSGEWFLGGGEGGSVTWMIASLCFLARITPLFPRNPPCILCTLRLNEISNAKLIVKMLR